MCTSAGIASDNQREKVQDSRGQGQSKLWESTLLCGRAEESASLPTLPSPTYYLPNEFQGERLI